MRMACRQDACKAGTVGFETKGTGVSRETPPNERQNTDRPRQRRHGDRDCKNVVVVTLQGTGEESRIARRKRLPLALRPVRARTPAGQPLIAWPAVGLLSSQG